MYWRTPLPPNNLKISVICAFLGFLPVPPSVGRLKPRVKSVVSLRYRIGHEDAPARCWCVGSPRGNARGVEGASRSRLAERSAVAAPTIRGRDLQSRFK